MTEESDKPKSGMRSDGSYREVAEDGLTGQTRYINGDFSRDFYSGNKSTSFMSNGDIRQSYHDKAGGLYVNERDGSLESMSVRVGDSYVPVKSTAGMAAAATLAFHRRSKRKDDYQLPGNLIDVAGTGVPAPAVERSTLSIIAFVLALVNVLLGWTVVVPILSIVFAGIGLHSRLGGRGFAIAAIVISAVSLAIDALVYGIMVAAFLSQTV